MFFYFFTYQMHKMTHIPPTKRIFAFCYADAMPQNHCPCHRKYALPLLLAILAAAAFGIAFRGLPLVGDDLHYHSAFLYWDTLWRQWVTRMHLHWLENNSRLGDMLNPLVLNLAPGWLRAAAAGVGAGGFFFGAMACARWRSPALLFTLMVFCLPWASLWMEHVCMINYVMSSALAFGCLWLLLECKTGKVRTVMLWAGLPFFFIAGGMHEALGLPLALSLVVYALVEGQRRKRTEAEVWAVVAMIAGGLFSISSPGNFTRASAANSGGENVILLLFGSAFFVLILAAACVYLAIKRRREMLELVHSDWLVFALMALFPTAFLLVSGFGGRPGWFAQVFALVALMRLPWGINAGGRRVLAVTGAAGAVAAIAHLCMLALWQQRLSAEMRRMVELYQEVASTDGIVFFNYTHDSDLPPYLLHRVRGVPDNDDSNYLISLAYSYGDPDVGAIILPKDASSLDMDTITAAAALSYSTISPAPDMGGHSDIPGCYSRPFFINGRQLLYTTPADPDPGQR